MPNDFRLHESFPSGFDWSKSRSVPRATLDIQSMELEARPARPGYRAYDSEPGFVLRLSPYLLLPQGLFAANLTRAVAAAAQHITLGANQSGILCPAGWGRQSLFDMFGLRPGGGEYNVP